MKFSFSLLVLFLVLLFGMVVAAPAKAGNTKKHSSTSPGARQQGNPNRKQPAKVKKQPNAKAKSHTAKSPTNVKVKQTSSKTIPPANPANNAYAQKHGTFSKPPCARCEL